MPKKPPVHELEFLRHALNHGELTRKLSIIGIAAPDILEYAKHICECWFRLGEEQLQEAEQALAAKCTRATFSRAYYAAYNTSKAVRYVTMGNVSLKGDDHQHASAKLPNDLPNVAQWAQHITVLYEHRLRSDYDNWSDSATNRSITPEDSVNLAREFAEVVRAYINKKFGMAL